MQLFEITAEISKIEKEMEVWAMEHEGDVTDFPLNDRLEAFEMEKEAKILSIAKYVKNLEAEATALKTEADKMAKRQKTAQAQADRMKMFLQNFAEVGTKYKDEQVVVSWRKSKAVYIDPKTKPEEMKPSYQKIKTTVDFDKTAIKKAIESGKDVDFCEIRTKHGIQIK